MKVGIAHGQQPYRLHASTSLFLTGHRNLFITTQSIQLVLLEVAAETEEIKIEEGSSLSPLLSTSPPDSKTDN